MRTDMSAQLAKKSFESSRTSPESNRLLELREEASKIARMLERDEITVVEASRRLRALTEGQHSILARIFGQ